MAGDTGLLAYRVPGVRGGQGEARGGPGGVPGGVPGRADVVPVGAEGGGGWRVLVVESDPAEADPLMRALRRHGHRAAGAVTGTAALRAYGQADLVLLDLDLPDLDGLEVCRSIRRVDDIPVIAVTSRDSELDRVLGLRAGADDYLAKPYGLQELMARMEAVMRRFRPHAPVPGGPGGGVTACGGLRIDTERRRATLAGRPLDLTPKEFDLLHLLAAHRGGVVPRKLLMQEVWAGSWSRRTLDTHVCSLRNKLGSGDWILTVRGVGFQIGPR